MGTRWAQDGHTTDSGPHRGGCGCILQRTSPHKGSSHTGWGTRRGLSCHASTRSSSWATRLACAARFFFLGGRSAPVLGPALSLIAHTISQLHASIAVAPTRTSAAVGGDNNACGGCEAESVGDAAERAGDDAVGDGDEADGTIGEDDGHGETEVSGVRDREVDGDASGPRRVPSATPSAARGDGGCRTLPTTVTAITVGASDAYEPLLPLTYSSLNRRLLMLPLWSLSALALLLSGAGPRASLFSPQLIPSILESLCSLSAQ